MAEISQVYSLDIWKGTILGVQNLTLYCNKIDSVIKLSRWIYKSSLAEEKTLDLIFLLATQINCRGAAVEVSK